MARAPACASLGSAENCGACGNACEPGEFCSTDSSSRTFECVPVPGDRCDAPIEALAQADYGGGFSWFQDLVGTSDTGDVPTACGDADEGPDFFLTYAPPAPGKYVISFASWGNSALRITMLTFDGDGGIDPCATTPVECFEPEPGAVATVMIDGPVMFVVYLSDTGGGGNTGADAGWFQLEAFREDLCESAGSGGGGAGGSGGGDLVCTPSTCGNGFLDPTEECDDANFSNADSCTTA